ncbi:partition protein [Xanthomonas phaseoli pv. phaseoli]|uniref:Partition protein n=1 Tax=Xanthomonas campestris pv. phaseoli TaxID=317013 RepID=A0AB34QGM8_XANCH|nr:MULTISPECIES: ParC family partition-associated protein [Xanthomonas]ATS91160.1 partition protein [Xanthomonas citri pv. phaseoli var. fuscans]KHS36677.1 partition protein [Xanthomonas phaseoli pv. phaseoli]TBW92899.1 partition protein [Xanthomonas citri pv. aurantifolii]
MITFDSDAVIDPVSFKEVLAAGGVNAATIGKADKGLVVVLRIAKKDRILGQYRGGPRYFSSLDGAGSVLVQHGIYQWETDAEGWVPRTLARAGKRTSDRLASAAG